MVSRQLVSCITNREELVQFRNLQEPKHLAVDADSRVGSGIALGGTGWSDRAGGYRDAVMLTTALQIALAVATLRKRLLCSRTRACERGGALG